MELSAIIRGDCSDEFTVSAQEMKRPIIGVLFCSCFELAEEQVARFPVHETDEAVATAFADDRVDFPVAELGTAFGSTGPLADMSFTRQAAATVIGSIAFSPLLSCAAQMRVERAPETAIQPDMLIDGFVADGEFAMAAQMAGDLLGAPLASQQGFDSLEIGAREVLIAAEARAPAVTFLNGFARSVAARTGGGSSCAGALERSCCDAGRAHGRSRID